MALATHNQLFGNMVERYRKQLGLTKTELAAASGVSRNALAHIENGTQNTNIVQLGLLASALNVYPQDLLPDMHNPDVYAKTEEILQAKALLRSMSSARQL